MPVEVEAPHVSDVVAPASKRPCLEEMARPILRFAKLTEKALMPTRGSKLAAGYDLYRYILCRRIELV